MGEPAEEQAETARRAIEIAEFIARQRTPEARRALLALYPPDTAEVLAELAPRTRAVAFRLLPRDRAAEAYTHLSSEQQVELQQQLTSEQLVQMFDAMDPDDRAELFDEMPGQLAAQLLAKMRPEERHSTQVILGYPPESVGRLMTPEYLALKPEWTVQEAIDHIRRKGREAETIYTLYVVDGAGRLLDDVHLHDLLLVAPSDTIRSLMDENRVALRADDDREEAVRAMERYDAPILPVVDREGVLVGIVTFDDVADVAKEEATEDFHKAAAVAPLETSYREARVLSLLRKRVGWLLALVAVNLVSSGVIAAFEETLAAAIALAFFIPLLIDSGGNAGSQAATLMIRAIATGDLRLDEWLRTVAKELRVGAGLGLMMGLASSLLGVFRGGVELGLEIGFIVGVSMFLIVLVANLIGTALPFLLSRLRIDPAVASTPLITSIADATGLLIYFFTASWVLGVT